MKQDGPSQGSEHRPHERVRALIAHLIEDLVVVTRSNRGRRPRPLTLDEGLVFYEELHLCALAKIGEEMPCVVSDPRARLRAGGDERDPHRAQAVRISTPSGPRYMECSVCETITPSCSTRGG